MKSKLGLLPSRLLLSAVGHDMTNGCRVAALEKVTSLSPKYRPPPSPSREEELWSKGRGVADFLKFPQFLPCLQLALQKFELWRICTSEKFSNIRCMPRHEERGQRRWAKKAFAEELVEECTEPGSDPCLRIIPTRPSFRREK